LQEPRIERIQIPFEGGTFPVYLQLPKSDHPVPVIISIGGLDSYKEYVAERYGPVYMKRSFGYVAVDGPHTGEATVRADEHGERIYSAVIDFLLSRSDVDRSRIGVQGVSNGGYWSTRTAFTEASRLRFAINWAGPLDQAWSSDAMRRAISSREYLFDLAQAFMAVYGYDTPEALIAGLPKLSIVKLGILDHPTPAMLIVNGLKDTLVPAADTLLLLQHGTPKSAWINPNGIHIGRTPDWPDERIMREVIMPWIEMVTANTSS
jgi:esterase FrsA